MSLRLNTIFLAGMITIFLLIFSFAEVLAQGKIVGHVKDQKTGEPLIGVNVIIEGTYLGAATDIDGDYTIVNVPVGQYSVKASMVGAATVLKKDVVIQTDRITTVNFELEQTAIQGKEVVVTAQRDILHKDVASSQVVINNKQITEAAGVRTLQDYLSTQAPITDEKYLNIRGGLASETGTIVNGLTFVNQRIGKTESFIPTSAVEEVSLKAGGMTAEYGDFRSGVINITTKTGTNDGYHGSFSFSRSPAHLKRFGKSLYDPSNNLLRSHLDPDIAFIGVDKAIEQGYITNYDKQQFYHNGSFRGDIFLSNPALLPSTWKSSLKAGESVTAVDMYLFDAWMHMVNPDWNKLNSKIQELKNSDQLSDAEKQRLGSEVTDQNLKNAFANHQNKEGQDADFNFDGGFGGPIPFIGHTLGDATFYLSNITNRTSYIQPLDLNYDLRTNTILAIKSNITRAITLKLTGSYFYEKGMSPARGADDELPSLGSDIGTGNTGNNVDKGAFVGENNISLIRSFGPDYWWYPTQLLPYEQRNLLVGADLTHAISATTFYNFTISYQRTKDYIDPSLSTTRSNDILAMIGPIPVNEMPYGRHILPVNASSFDLNGWTFDQFISVPGLSERFDSKGGPIYDHSITQQLRMKLNFGSQLSKVHFIKAGLEYNYVDLNNRRYAYWPAQDYLSAYEYNFRVFPRSYGAYVQDQITFEDMIATIGIRMDHYSNGNLLWPTGDPFSAAAFDNRKPPADWLQIIQNGGSVMWDRWNEVNREYIAEGKEPLLQSTKSWTVFSPRFGVSFPISERAKFYFNYGHYRQMPAFSELYFYNSRWDKNGLYNLGNPNMPPIKTIQYELGVDYNLLDQYLIHIAGYYKDVSGESRQIQVQDNSGSLNYPYRADDRYREIEGIEFTFTKSVGEWITGWVDLQYTYKSEGNAGRRTIAQNPATNNSEGAFYNDNPTVTQPIPSINANVNLRTPDSWGYFAGGWNFSFMPMWELGALISDNVVSNPRGVTGVNKEFRWPDVWNFNMKISKTFDLSLTKATIYVDINNLFNRKTFLYAYSAFSSDADETNYFESLHLPNYGDSYYDAIRDETNGSYLYPGYIYTQDVTNPVSGISHKKGDVVTGKDKIGDLRSSDKPYINNPDNDIFTYGNPRQVWLGIRFDF